MVRGWAFLKSQTEFQNGSKTVCQEFYAIPML